MTNRFGQRDLYDFADAIQAGEHPSPTNELEDTYLRVDRAMGESPMPTISKQQTWENVMTTLALPQTPTYRMPRRPVKRIAWGPFATVALVAMLVIASFGTWTLMNTSVTPTPPPLAPGLAGLTPGMQIDLPASPQVDLLASAGCDTSASIPVINGVTQPPIEGDVIYTNGETLFARCSAGEVELGTGVFNVAPSWSHPGILMYTTTVDGVMMSNFLNLRTGEEFATDFGQRNHRFPVLTTTSQANDWIIATDDEGNLVMANLSSMTTIPMTDLLGVEVPHNRQLFYAGASDADVVAVSMLKPTEENPSLELDFEFDMQGDILIVREDGSSSWVDLEGDIRVDNILLSPDGSTMALTFFDWDNGGTIVTLMTTESGEIYGQYPMEENRPLTEVWWDAEGGLVFTDATSLMRMPATTGSEVETIYSHDTDISNLRPTSNPDYVVVTSRMDHGSDAQANATDRDAVISVNLRDGSAQEFRGMEMTSIWAAMYTKGSLAPAPILLMFDWQGTGEAVTEVRAIDPVTGEMLTSFETSNPHDRSMSASSGKNQMAFSADGMIQVIGMGDQLLVIDGSEPTPAVTIVDAPENVSLARSMITVNDEGTMMGVSISDEGETRYLVDLTTEQPEWIRITMEVPSPSGWIGFIIPITSP